MGPPFQKIRGGAFPQKNNDPLQYKRFSNTNKMESKYKKNQREKDNIFLMLYMNQENLYIQTDCGISMNINYNYNINYVIIWW